MMGGHGAVFAVAGVLAAVNMWEVVDMPRSHVGPLRSFGQVPGPAAPRVHADTMQAWVGPILARPLFSPDRRPAAAPDDAAAAGMPGPPRLTGILIGPFGRSAIFARGASRLVALGEGGRIATYTVRSIDAAELRPDGPHGLQRRQSAFDARSLQVPTPPAPTGRTGQATHSR